MEIFTTLGLRYTIEGDMVKVNDREFYRWGIGPNYMHGSTQGSHLSSYSDTITNEILSIQCGMDEYIYAKLGNIDDAYQLLNEKMKDIDNPDIYTISRIVLETVDEYFNGIANVAFRSRYYLTTDQDGYKNNRISNLKGKGAAACVERSVLAHNLLKSLGINSFYKSSGIVKNGNNEVHSYNLIEYQGKYYIFDTSMPNLIDDKPNPLIAEIDKESFDLIRYPLNDNGISITVSHYNPYRDSDVTITYDSHRSNFIDVEPLSKSISKNL